MLENCVYFNETYNRVVLHYHDSLNADIYDNTDLKCSGKYTNKQISMGGRMLGYSLDKKYEYLDTSIFKIIMTYKNENYIVGDDNNHFILEIDDDNEELSYDIYPISNPYFYGHFDQRCFKYNGKDSKHILTNYMSYNEKELTVDLFLATYASTDGTCDGSPLTKTMILGCTNFTLGDLSVFANCSEHVIKFKSKKHIL